jgi:hypothetical protein
MSGAGEGEDDVVVVGGNPDGTQGGPKRFLPYMWTDDMDVVFMQEALTEGCDPFAPKGNGHGFVGYIRTYEAIAASV